MPPTQISHYTFTRKLGVGTYGEVYEAVHVRSPELRVAIKLVAPALVQDSRFVDALTRECLQLDRLDHPNIVRFRDLVVNEGQVAMVLELLAGQDLHDRLANGPLPVETAVSVLEAILEGLAYAHGRGILHRDIKPGNVYWCDDGRIKLLDFGIARAADGTQATKTGHMVGTFDYMAPERFDGQHGSASSDVYAVGLIAWELLTGRPACPEGEPGRKMKWHLVHGIGGPGAVLAAVPGCPPWLAEVVATLSAIEVAERPADGAAALALLREKRAGAAGSASASTPTGRRPPPATVMGPASVGSVPPVAASVPPRSVPPAPSASVGASGRSAPPGTVVGPGPVAMHDERPGTVVSAAPSRAPIALLLVGMGVVLAMGAAGLLFLANRYAGHDEQSADLPPSVDAATQRAERAEAAAAALYGGPPSAPSTPARTDDTGKAALSPHAASVPRAKTVIVDAGATEAAAPRQAPFGARGTLSLTFTSTPAPSAIEVTCPSGFRERAGVDGSVASIANVPSEENCTMLVKGVPGTPAPVRGGRSLSCAIVGTTTTCGPPSPPARATSPTSFTMRVNIPGRAARLRCGDGQTVDFDGSTAIVFESTTTCLVQIDRARGSVTASQACSATCVEADGKVVCGGC